MAEAEDKIELKSNGHIILVIDGKEYDCRRPKGGEYLEMNELAVDMADAMPDDVNEMAINPTEVKKLDTKELKQVTRTMLELTGGWFVKMIELLSETPFEGSATDMPPWVMGGESIQGVIQHWISVPFVGSGK